MRSYRTDRADSGAASIPWPVSPIVLSGCSSSAAQRPRSRSAAQRRAARGCDARCPATPSSRCHLAARSLRRSRCHPPGCRNHPGPHPRRGAGRLRRLRRWPLL